MEKPLIREETEHDYTAVEELTREAFWNVNVPGCDEHCLVHAMRRHPDFLPELALVAECNGRIIGNIMYTKSKLTDESGMEKTILTFGPVSIHPDFQRQGFGTHLLERSFEKALGLGYDAIVIFGNPDNYVSRGFVSCKKHNIFTESGACPAAMLVKELRPGALDGRKWTYQESPAYQIDPAQAEDFDKQFPPKKKEYRPSQEMFYILSHSTIG